MVGFWFYIQEFCLKVKNIRFSLFKLFAYNFTGLSDNETFGKPFSLN